MPSSGPRAASRPWPCSPNGRISTWPIVDIRLPGISGFEFIKRARAGRPALTFLIYTGSTEYGQEADVAGVATKNIFTKPLADLCVLSDAIRRGPAARERVRVAT